MSNIVYEFRNINSRSSYIYQFISGRKLTPIYHSHNFYEVIIMLNGECIQYANGKEHCLAAGTVTILKPGDAHCFRSQSENYRLISLSVEANEAAFFHHAFSLSEVINAPSNILMFDISRKEQMLIQSFPISGIEPSECCLKALYSTILMLYTESLNRSKEIPLSLQNAVQKMAEQANLLEGTSAFVRLSGYSRSHLTRLVHAYYGTTLQSFVMNLRLDAANTDIVLTNESLESIAMKYGYASFSHFCKIYKKKFGTTPAMARKKQKLLTA